ncbi:MAG: hypothetical protein AAGD17_05240 [Bacteroidota bacterium]
MRFVFVSILFLVLLNACSSSEDDSANISNSLPSEVGNQIFQISFSSATSNSQIKELENNQDLSALLTIANNDGATVYEREKVKVSLKDDVFETEFLEVGMGNNILTEFIIFDDNSNKVIYIAPKLNSSLSQFTSKSLPQSFSVEKDKIQYSDVQVFNAQGYSNNDFGYSDIGLNFQDSVKSFVLSVDDSEFLSLKTIRLKSLTGSNYSVDWGDGSTQQIKSEKGNSNIVSEITHRFKANGTYDIKISGPLEALVYVKFVCDEQEFSLRSNLVFVDLSQLISLTEIEFYQGSLSELDISHSPKLEKISLGFNNLISLNLTSNPNLKSAWLRYNQLNALDISQNTNLNFLWVTGNKIKQLNTGNNPVLGKLLARENEIPSIDLTLNTQLTVLDLSDNFLNEIDLSRNKKLIELNVGRNNLTELDISLNLELERLDIYENQITEINFEGNPKLRDLYANDNLFHNLDLSICPNLERLHIGGNSIESLDLSLNPNVFDFTVNKNLLGGNQINTIISVLYNNATSGSLKNGFVDFNDNPGSNKISSDSSTKIDELVSSYDWFFNFY